MSNAIRNVSIYTRMDDGRWLWSGDGHIDGGIVCTADLGDDVYQALDDTIGDEDGEYTVEVDGVEYRVNVTTEYRCECGDVTGERCQWSGPAADTVIVEYMPQHLRSSHTAAGNTGIYPANGAHRIRVERSCADLICDDDWTTVVGQ